MTRRKDAPLLLLLLAAVCGMVTGYPSGPPASACDSMTPVHGPNTMQTSPSPFRVTLSQKSFTRAVEKITVTLDTPCGIAFKGFMLQARLANSVDSYSSLVGSFSSSGGQQFVACGSNQVIAHVDSTEKNNLEFEWVVPASLTDHVVFVATFVQGFAVYYVKVYSEVLKYTSKLDALPNGTFPTPHNCTAVGGVTLDAECGNTKSCFSDCGIDGKCGFVVSWKPEADDIVFELKAGLDGSEQRWIGLGFSFDDKMGDDKVIECAYAVETMKSVNHSVNNGKSNVRSGGLDYTAISLADNVLSCSLAVPRSNNPVFNVNTKYTLLFASGRTRSESTTEKSKHTSLPVVSGEQADLTSSIQFLSSQAASNVLVKAHGSLMILAWVFAASFGLVIARYYKRLGGSHRWFGLHIWFQIHRFAMILTFTLAAIAFIIIFVDVKGYSQAGKGPDDLKFLQAHPILGIISTALVVINPLMALVRPHPGASTRPIFNWFHWGVGTTAWIVSMVTIFIGFEIEKSGVGPNTKYVMAAFVAYQLLIELLLELHGCLQKSDQKTDEYEMKVTNGKNPEVARHSMMTPGKGGAGVFRSVILVAHFFILLGFLIALLALVNLQMLRSAYNFL